jgi:hypothetical protein
MYTQEQAKQLDHLVDLAVKALCGNEAPLNEKAAAEFRQAFTDYMTQGASAGY